jgi:hypothetical protein
MTQLLYKYLIYLLLLLKFIYLITNISHIILVKQNKEYGTLDNTLTHINEYVEFVFIAFMSLILLYLFFPLRNNIPIIDKETKILLFVYGAIQIVSLDWTLFIEKSVIYNFIKQ